MNGAAIDIVSLGFSHPRQPVPLFSNLNLSVPRGARFGLFGPNGAGKTTLMNLMTGLLSYNKGSITLEGHEIRERHTEAKRLFGFVPQDFSFYPELSPAENLHFFGAWSGLDAATTRRRTTELLEVMHLTDVRNKPVEKFSGGMKRRVNLAIGVIHEPRILFLDEPTVGVDIQTRHSIIQYIKELNRSGTTLAYTSHQLNEAEELCDEVAMIDQGRIIAHGPIHELLYTHGHNGLEELFLALTGKSYRNEDV